MFQGPKMLLKLVTKCLVKLSSNFKNFITEDVKVFDLLIEIYKMFKLHPPENLKVIIIHSKETSLQRI